MKLLPLVLALLFVGCTDAECSGISAYGSSARITCHSGGKVIFDGCSTGKVANEPGSDGYNFKDSETERHVSVSGECFIDYEAPCPKESIRPNKTAPTDSPAASR